MNCPNCGAAMEHEPHVDDDRNHMPTRRETFYWCEDCGLEASSLEREIVGRAKVVIVWDPRVENALDVDRRQFAQYGWKG